MFELPEPHFTFSKKYLIQQHSIPANPSSAARTAAKVSAVLLVFQCGVSEATSRFQSIMESVRVALTV